MNVPSKKRAKAEKAKFWKTTFRVEDVLETLIFQKSLSFQQKNILGALVSALFGLNLLRVLTRLAGNFSCSTNP